MFFILPFPIHMYDIFHFLKPVFKGQNNPEKEKKVRDKDKGENQQSTTAGKSKEGI